MPRRSPFTSVTPALSIATSVPVPIAMPTSAWASAGASLMPSPAIATTRALAPAARSTTSAFCSGSTSAIDLVDAERARHGLAPWSRLSPVSMTMRRPSRVQRRDRLAASSP